MDRVRRLGVCRQPLGAAIVHDWFLHPGEEDPLVPSGTIFYGGCNFRCVFCQNYEVSQTSPLSGTRLDPRGLAAVQGELRLSGALNINHVGGEPTPSLPVVLESLVHLDVSVPQLWNSNFYMTPEAMELLRDVVDIWLPDFKYGNDECALRLSGAPKYVEVVTRNLLAAVDSGDVIVRHLVLPGHLECCTRPALRWISENLPRDRILVNIMDQYRPEYLVARRPGWHRWSDVSRMPSADEIREAREIARELGLVYEPISRSQTFSAMARERATMDAKSLREMAERLSKLELEYADRLRSSAEGVGNPAVRAVMLAVAQDSVKHSMLYGTIAELLRGEGPLMDEKQMDRLAREIDDHIRVEEEMIREARELSSSASRECVKLVAESIAEDEERHHRLLVAVRDVILRRETLTEDEIWEMTWKYAVWHGTPGG
ncbi:MAG: radical SAM protein [Conexivisphaera sp.]